MIFARFAILPVIAATLFLTLGFLTLGLLSPGVFAVPAAEPDRVDLRIEIFGFAGFHVLTNRTSIESSAERYAIAMDLDTRGIASIFVDLRSHSEVYGRLTRDAPHPEAYRGDVRRNGIDRHYRVDYRSDGTVRSEPAPPPAERRVSSGADQMRGTVDQLTAYFILERQLTHRGTCALVVPVFDGRTRYNLRVSDGRPETLSANGFQHFAGPTQVCDVTREEVLVDKDQGEETYRRGKIWYAHLGAGEQMVPVRMEYDTEFGIVNGYLAELHGAGGHLQLME